MFDPTSVENYRAVKAPSALRERLEAIDSAPRRKRNVTRLWPVAAAIAACLMLTAIGLFPKSSSRVTITAQPLVAVARVADTTVPHTTLLLTADGELTLESADAALSQEDGQALTFPHVAQNELTLLWSITDPEVTLTVNGQTYTLHADLTSGAVTVQ